MLIAVIDSGIDQSDVMLRGIQIKSKTVELHHKNKHGTNIVKIIVRDNLIEQFISIQILDENNKGQLNLLIEAIEYCIENNVDVINLSLGLVSISCSRLDLLYNTIKKAIDKNIIIFAAENNRQNNTTSYPAAFKEVYSVSYAESNCSFIFREESKEIVFNRRTVYMPNKSESKIVCGNSYLCPLVTALYLSWKRDSLKNTSFNGFLSLLSKRNVFDKILYSNTSLINDTDLRKYPILYFSNDSNKDSINLKEFLNEHGELRVYKSLKELLQAMDCTEKIIVFLGMITENINIYDKNYLHMIYRNCVKNKIKNISVVPYIPIYNIIKTYLENNFAIQIIYL